MKELEIPYTYRITNDKTIRLASVKIQVQGIGEYFSMRQRAQTFINIF